MSETTRVNAERLRKLGVGEDLIAEAAGNAERGVLRLEPSAALMERLLERARQLTPQTDDVEEAAPAGWRVPAWIAAAASLPAETALLTAYTRCSSMGTMTGRYADGLKVALMRRQQPLVIVENHNIIDPKWWREDPVFRNLRSACHVVNKAAMEIGGRRSTRLIVLRATPSAYSGREIEELHALIEEATSDIYWIPPSKAGIYAGRDIVVIGEECAFQIDRPAASPAEALGMMILSETTLDAREQRGDILQVVSRAESITAGGVIQPNVARVIEHGGIKAVLEMVLLG